MKANELMIGDLLYDKVNDYYGEVTGVIDNGEIYIDGVIAYVSDYIPILITPEILEKNGWEYNNYNNETEYEEEYYVDENGFDIHINGKNFEVRCIDAINIQLKYLHELQHTLRLCGIEKTIEL